MNIVDPILFQARWQPFELALCAPGSIFGSVTYGQLARMILSVERKAAEHGLASGKVAALFIKDPILHVVFVLALARIGVVTVSARELTLPKSLHVDAIFADLPYQLGDSRSLTVIDKSWAMIEGPLLMDHGPINASEDAPCRMILTSGTTGHPKVAVRTTRHVLRRVQEIQAVYGNRFPDCSRIFMTVGLSTGVAHTFVVHTLSRGGTLFMPGPSAAETLERLSAYRIQALLAPPNSLAEMAGLCEKTQAFRGGLDVVISTGSMVTKALSERVRALLSTNFVCSYGSTEAGVAASGPASEMSAIEGAVGYIAPGVAVDIIGDSGERLPAGKEGRVCIRRAGMVDGYLGDSDEARRQFREGGFFPGDVGMVTPSGVLVISGREHAVINFGGDKVHPERVEAALTSFPKVRDAAAFVATDTHGVQRVAAALAWHGEPDVPGLREHLERLLPSRFLPTLFVAVDAIPRNTSGKVDRAKLRNFAAKRMN
jgi:acyl-coenzyme A synthetase/AMP-(fatty) acid ligase